MTDDTNDEASITAAGTLSVGYLDLLSPGYPAPVARYSVTSQVQWVGFNSKQELRQEVAHIRTIADAERSTGPTASQEARPKKPAADEPSRKLSEREKSCLSWTAVGKSSWEIGQILSISENTATFHIKNAMKKLGVASRTLAALKAVQLGLIEPVAEPKRRP